MADEKIENVASNKLKKKAFKFRQRHTVLLLRQALGGNPHQAKIDKETSKILQSIFTSLAGEGIDAKAKSLEIKCAKPLDDFDKAGKIPPVGQRAGYEEFQILLKQVSTLRKSETKRPATEKPRSGNSKKSKEQAALAQANLFGMYPWRLW